MSVQFDFGAVVFADVQTGHRNGRACRSCGRCGLKSFEETRLEHATRAHLDKPEINLHSLLYHLFS